MRRRTWRETIQDYSTLVDRLFRQQREVTARERPKRAKMTLVEGEQAMRSVPVRDDNRAEVGETSVEIIISMFEVNDYRVVLGRQAGHGKTPSGKIVQERQPCRTAKSTAQKVIDLGRCWCRDYEFARLIPQ